MTEEHDEGLEAQQQLRRQFEDIAPADPQRYKVLVAALAQLFAALEIAKYALPLDDEELGEFLTQAKDLHSHAARRSVPTFSELFSYDPEAA